MKPERYKVKSISEVAQNQNKYNQSEIESIINELKLKQGAKIPPLISKDEFIAKSLFKNSNNIFKHFENYKDYYKRMSALGMVEPTIKKYDIRLFIKEKDNNGELVEKYKYIKKFGKKYMFVSASKNNELIYTFFYDMRIRQIEKEIKLSIVE